MDIKEYRDLVHKHTETFKPADAINAIKAWIEEYAQVNHMNKAVLGISGGKDSTIVAKLLVDVLGKDNVFGLLMPNGEQKDINDSLRVVELLDIGYKTVNIANTYYAMLDMFGEHNNISEEAKINIAPRIRMTTLYTWGQTHGYRVAGTGNLSERLLGYFTKWGDGGCDFNIIGGFTSLEVMRIGEELGLPLDLVYKTPADGLSGISDEEKLGVTYIDVHNYLRKGYYSVESKIADKIIELNSKAIHKLNMPAMLNYKYCPVKLPTKNCKVKVKFKDELGENYEMRADFNVEHQEFQLEHLNNVPLNKVVGWRYIE